VTLQNAENFTVFFGLIFLRKSKSKPFKLKGKIDSACKPQCSKNGLAPDPSPHQQISIASRRQWTSIAFPPRRRPG
jgi:hypothetical protein